MHVHFEVSLRNSLCVVIQKPELGAACGNLAPVHSNENSLFWLFLMCWAWIWKPVLWLKYHLRDTTPPPFPLLCTSHYIQFPHMLHLWNACFDRTFDCCFQCEVCKLRAEWKKEKVCSFRWLAASPWKHEVKSTFYQMEPQHYKTKVTTQIKEILLNHRK